MVDIGLTCSVSLCRLGVNESIHLVRIYDVRITESNDSILPTTERTINQLKQNDRHK
ncbi:hypothetical protein O9992_18160 [Vibrio lentus]|nr:hypothetical protein [Vibrio lentus]